MIWTAFLPLVVQSAQPAASKATMVVQTTAGVPSKEGPSQAGNILETSDINYLFTSKIDITGDGVDSSNNDWSIVFDTGSETSGTYTISDSLMASIGDFLLVVKAANNPGWAAYSFFGDSNNSNSGDFDVSWDKGLSHISLFAVKSSSVPEPSTLFLFGASLLGLGIAKRRKK